MSNLPCTIWKRFRRERGHGILIGLIERQVKDDVHYPGFGWLHGRQEPHLTEAKVWRSHVTGEGQKTSSVLNRALSRIEMKILAETIRLSDRSWGKAQVLLSVETEETQLGSLGDQVSSYLYYTRYAERPTTDATWNTPIV